VQKRLGLHLTTKHIALDIISLWHAVLGLGVWRIIKLLVLADKHYKKSPYADVTNA